MLPHDERPYAFCPMCGGDLETRSVKTSEPERLVCSRCGFIFYLDPKVAHELFGECFGRLDLRRGTCRAENVQALGAKGIDDASGEGRFGSDDCQRDGLAAGECREGIEIGSRIGEASRQFGDAGIARGGEESERGVVLLESPRERVLTAAAPDNQSFHLFVLNALLNASRARLKASPNCWKVSRVFAP